LVLAENQRHNAEKLDSAGVVCNLGGYEKASKEQIGLALRNIMLDKDVRARLSMRGQELVDGAGAERTVTLMTLGQIRLRPVQEQDCELVWKWTNDPDVRRSAFNSELILWEEHKRWFLKKLTDPHCFQYVALGNHGSPLGQIRFDIHDSIAEVDYSIDRNYRGLGLGAYLLKSGFHILRSKIGKPLTILGRAKKENILSHRVFMKTGFSSCDISTDEEIPQTTKEKTEESMGTYQFKFLLTKDRKPKV